MYTFAVYPNATIYIYADTILHISNTGKIIISKLSKLIVVQRRILFGRDLNLFIFFIFILNVLSISKLHTYEPAIAETSKAYDHKFYV